MWLFLAPVIITNIAMLLQRWSSVIKTALELSIFLMTFYRDEPLDLGRRLYVGLATERDTMALVHFDSPRRCYAYNPLVRVLRRWGHKFVNQQTVSQINGVRIPQDTAFVIVGAVFDRRVINHQIIIRQSYDPLVVLCMRLRFDVQILAILLPRDHVIFWNNPRA